MQKNISDIYFDQEIEHCENGHVVYTFQDDDGYNFKMSFNMGGIFLGLSTKHYDFDEIEEIKPFNIKYADQYYNLSDIVFYLSDKTAEIYNKLFGKQEYDNCED